MAIGDERRAWSDNMDGLVHIIRPRIDEDGSVMWWMYLCGGKTLSSHMRMRNRDRDAIPSCLSCIGAVIQ